MEKDFRPWHDKKTVINSADGAALFHEREVWWCSLGSNIGYEQDGRGESFTRPVVILTKFNLDSCLIVPLTTRSKTGKYYFPVGDIDQRSAVAVLSQVRYIDRKRLAVKITTLNSDIFQSLLSAVVDVCFPDQLK